MTNAEYLRGLIDGALISVFVFTEMGKIGDVRWRSQILTEVRRRRLVRLSRAALRLEVKCFTLRNRRLLCRSGHSGVSLWGH
jgi:hypothetical protein